MHAAGLNKVASACLNHTRSAAFSLRAASCRKGKEQPGWPKARAPSPASAYATYSKAVPTAAPASDAQLEALVHELQRASRVVALTGAGVSTEAGVPDYRGPHGAYSTGFKPMTHQQVGDRPADPALAAHCSGWR